MGNPKTRSIEVDGQTIVVGDCLDHMASLDDGTIDVVITSPPYNIGTDYSTYDDRDSRDDYLTWMSIVFGEIKRVLADDGSFFLNVDGSRGEPWVPMQVAAIAGEHFVLQNSIIWVKSISVDGSSFGHFKPINSPRYLNHNFEFIFHLTKSGSTPIDRLAVGVPYAHKSNVRRWKGREPRDLRCNGDVWFIPYETIQSRSRDRGNHPATFPVELATRCIKLHGMRPDLVVMDPFLGSGTTLLATRRLGLQGVGVELDEDYAEYSSERVMRDDRQDR